MAPCTAPPRTLLESSLSAPACVACTALNISLKFKQNDCGSRLQKWAVHPGSLTPAPQNLVAGRWPWQVSPSEGLGQGTLGASLCDGLR